MNPIVAAVTMAAMALAYKKYNDALKKGNKRKADEYLTILQNNSELTNKIKNKNKK